MTTATARKVTPAAVQVLPASAPEHEWLAARRNGVGSSDIAKIAGVSDRQQAAHVYHDKRGTLLNDDAGEEAYWGKRHEPTVADEWCRRNASVIRRVGLVANVDEPWMMCTLDRLVRECPLDRGVKARCALEVKTRSAFKAARWHKTVPDDVLAQTVWQRLVTGLDHIHVAVLIGGNSYRQAVVRHEPDVEAFLLSEGRQFWHSNVLAKVEPAWMYSSNPDDLLALDQQLNPVKDGQLDLDVKGVGEVLEYARAARIAGDAKLARDAAAARLAHLADGARHVTFDHRPAYSYNEVAKSNCDLAKLAELHPKAYADCVTEKTHYAINIAQEYRIPKGTQL